jgi:hemerythrin-like domain-containing protein
MVATLAPSHSHPRRAFLRQVAVAATLAVAGCAGDSSGREDEHGEHGELEVTPVEDLMREHGVMERVLLAYDEIARRIEVSEAFESAALTDAAGIVQRFIESFHEKNEEQFVFPRLQQANREVELVTTLLKQHQRGRDVTAEILRLAAAPPVPALAQALRAFARMYRPHAAREDTVLFPAFKEVIGASAYRELSEQFEDKEREVIGEHGFDRAVAQIARIERALGIGDLVLFTP